MKEKNDKYVSQIYSTHLYQGGMLEKSGEWKRQAVRQVNEVDTTETLMSQTNHIYT